MASPTIIKAKVSSSAKAKPVASSSTTPRVVVRGPGLDTNGLSLSRPVASAPSTPVLQPRVTAKLTSSSRPKPGTPTPGQSPMQTHTLPRPRTVSTSSRPAINRTRTGSVYSLSAVAQPAHHVLRPQSPVRSVVSAGARAHYLGPGIGTGPHSPPTSVLSIQSASTSSMTSASTGASASTNSPISPKAPHAPIVRAKITATSARNVSPARLTLPDSEDDKIDLNALSSDSDDDDDNASTKTGSSSLDPAMEAKVNRKIADLEITNASLLTINASLEALKARQQKEIWELRRKLRETRLALPPPVFAALKDKDAPREEQEEEEEDEVETQPERDPAFERLSALVQSLLDDAREALSASVAPVKVLSAHEVRAWEGRRYSSAGDGADGDRVEKESGDEDGDARDEREVTVMLDRTPSPP